MPRGDSETELLHPLGCVGLSAPRPWMATRRFAEDRELVDAVDGRLRDYLELEGARRGIGISVCDGASGRFAFLPKEEGTLPQDSMDRRWR